MTPTCVPGPTLSIIITAYNDAEAIPALAGEIAAAMGATGMGWEAIWIDDGSTDQTLARLRELPAPHRHVAFARNQGQSAGYRAGAEAATGEWLATLDGDGQNDPADLPRLLSAAHDQGHDLAIGIRARRADGWARRLTARLGNRVRDLATGVRVADAGCATRVVRRERFLELPFFHGNYYFLPALTVMVGGTFCELPVNHRPRRHGHTHYGIRNRLVPGLVDLIGVCWLRRRHRRWRLALQPSAEGTGA